MRLRSWLRASALVREKQITKKVEGRGVNVGVGAPRADQRPFEVASVCFVGWAVKVDVGPINRKAGYDLLQRTLENSPRQIGRHRALFGEARRSAAERIELARHLVVHDPDFAVPRDLVEWLTPPGE